MSCHDDCYVEKDSGWVGVGNLPRLAFHNNLIAVC